MRTGSQASARSTVAGRAATAAGTGCLALALAACSGPAKGPARPSPSPATPEQVKPTDADGLARYRVQNYLDAMRVKDVPKGRAQLCANGQAEFDTSATDDGGDFADHFTVEASTVSAVEADPVGRKVTVSVTLKARASGASAPVSVAFTVSGAVPDWCIASEELLSRPALPGATVPTPATTVPTPGVPSAPPS